MLICASRFVILRHVDLKHFCSAELPLEAALLLHKVGATCNQAAFHDGEHEWAGLPPEIGSPVIRVRWESSREYTIERVS